MYKRLPVVEDAEARATDAAYSDRIRFRPFLVAAEQYAAAHKLILHGHAANRLLTGQSEIDFESMALSFYCAGAGATHARALADLLWEVAPDGLSHYTTMVTKIPGRVFAISVDGRDLVTLTSIEPDRHMVNKTIKAMLTPVQLRCMDVTVQLMDLYAGLCDPAQAGEWAAMLEVEPGVRAAYGKSEAPPHASAPVPAALLQFAAGPGRVLVGPAALGRGARAPGGVLQLVSAEPLESEAQAILAAIGRPARWAIHRANVPSAPRLKRLSVYDGAATIAEVYNAGAYELVPFARRAVGGVECRVGTPFAVARFGLADAWMARPGRRASGVAAAAALAAATPPAELLPVADYVGRSVDHMLEQRRSLQAAADAGRTVKFYGPYMPAQRTRTGAAEDYDEDYDNEF